MTSEMGEFWDERAKENAPFFIFSKLDYNDPDLERFWRSGPHTVDTLMGAVGASIAPDDDIVEVGCGTGRLTRVLAERGRSVRAIDVSGEMLARAEELNPQLENVTWVHGDGTGFTGIDDTSADGVFSHVVFQHIPDPEITYGYIREMARVLRPGGWAAFQVSNDPSIHQLSAGLKHRILARLSRAPRGQDNPAWRGSAVDLGRLTSEATDAGLEVVKISGEGQQLCYVHLRKPPSEGVTSPR